MTCKDVSTLISKGELADAPLARRLAVRLHLAMCRHCRAFRRQVEAISGAARAAAAVLHEEPAAEFEADLTRRMRHTRRGSG